MQIQRSSPSNLFFNQKQNVTFEPQLDRFEVLSPEQVEAGNER